MHTQTWKSRIGLPVLAGLVSIAIAVAGSATINERNTSTHAAGEPRERVGDNGSVRQSLLAAGPRDQAARKRPRCKECGVVESVNRIEPAQLADGVCTNADEGNVLGAYVLGRGEGGEDMPTLANLVRRAASEWSGAQRVSPPSRYRIVIRLRSGARQVFDEATPSTLRSGDFVDVI